MNKISKLMAAGVLAISASFANASTILAPTDGDVNFFAPLGFLDAGLSLAIFDDLQAVAGGSAIDTSAGLLEVQMASGFLFDSGIIDFLGNVGVGGAYQASNQIDLFDFPVDGSADNFIVGLGVPDGFGGTTWIADSGFFPENANAGTLIFDVGRNGISTIAVDVQVIPVPAAVWLFGSGLLGLVAVARRRA